MTNATKETLGLEPCPRCNCNRPRTLHDTTTYRAGYPFHAYCPGCSLGTIYRTTEAEAVAEWNRLAARANPLSEGEPVGWRLTWDEVPYGFLDHVIWHRDHLAALEEEAANQRTFPGVTNVKITPLYAASPSRPLLGGGDPD